MTTDVIGVYDDDSNQLFSDAIALRASVKISAEFPSHPLEDGGTISDNRIFKPTEITLSVILKPDGYASTYSEIVSAYTGTDALTVVTRGGTYTDMFIQALPREENTQVFDTLAINITLREIQFATTVYATLSTSDVATASNASTTKTGEKKTTSATTSQTSAAYDLFFGAS